MRRRYFSVVITSAFLGILLTMSVGGLLFASHGMAMRGQTDCVSHCLSVTRQSTATPTPIFALTLLVAFVGVWALKKFGRSNIIFHVGLQEIGKFLLHQKLATVVLRN